MNSLDQILNTEVNNSDLSTSGLSNVDNNNCVSSISSINFVLLSSICGIQTSTATKLNPWTL